MDIKVFKFGGASVKDAISIKNILSIVDIYKNDKLMIIVSAMGKTTNNLEKLADAICFNPKDIDKHFVFLKEYHTNIINDLFDDKKHLIYAEVNTIFETLFKYTKQQYSNNYDKVYDQIVSFGELLSTKIISAFLNFKNYNNIWLDIRNIIKTDLNFRDASVDWETTNYNVQNNVKSFFENDNNIIISQGYIASDSNKIPTTLGREGSDYTAAIMAYCLDATEVTIWKDVAGVLNASPKYFENTVKLDNISYLEAIELSYYGATVIHPKTIKPLQNKNIPLFVKSFLNPNEEGTIINNTKKLSYSIPCIILKPNQILISISPKDFSFIAEENLSSIFSIFARFNFKINMMQNSAISFSVCFDNNSNKLQMLINEIRDNYNVKYNDNVQLLTIRHYNNETILNFTKNKKVLLEQKSRQTCQLIIEQTTEAKQL